LSCIGLGGNIPIDALIALEFLPQNRRNLVSLLSLWQPVGVVAASGIAYGTVAKYRCNPDLPSCRAPGLAAGGACCQVSDNFGWRVLLGVLGGVTLLIFFLRFFVFNFHESPKFLLSKGKEQEAIDVLHRIAKFNRQPPPALTVEHFRAIDIDAGIDPKEVEQQRALTWKESTVRAWANFKDSIFKLKGLFGNRLQAFIFVLLAITYMVSRCEIG
jgi:MFS family permease